MRWSNQSLDSVTLRQLFHAGLWERMLLSCWTIRESCFFSERTLGLSLWRRPGLWWWTCVACIGRSVICYSNTEYWYWFFLSGYIQAIIPCWPLRADVTLLLNMLSMHWTFRHLPLVYWELVLDFCLGMVLVTVLEFIFNYIKAGPVTFPSNIHSFYLFLLMIKSCSCRKFVEIKKSLDFCSHLFSLSFVRFHLS